MMWFLNRARGGALSNGSVIATLALLCVLLSVLMYIGHYQGALIVSWSVALLYNALERIGGWGLWTGTLCVLRYDGFKLHAEREGGKWTGIQWLAEKLIPPTQSNWLWHCRLALFLRGLWWLACLLPLAYYIEWQYVLASIVCLGISFPLACEIGYYTGKLWKVDWKYFQMRLGHEHQEVWYGVLQDIAIGVLLWHL